MSLKGFHANLTATLILVLAGQVHAADVPQRATPAPPPGPQATSSGTAPAPGSAGKQVVAGDPSPAAKSSPYVHLIERLYQEGQPDAAMIGVRSASGSTELGKKALAQLAVLEGMLQVDLIQDDAARDAFTRAFSLDYDAVLPSYASSKAAQLFKTTQAGYQKTHVRPSLEKSPDSEPRGDEWKWGLLGGGAAGTVAGIVVMASSNGQQSTLGGVLLGAGAVSAIIGTVALLAQEPAATKAGSMVSIAVTPRGDVMALCAARF